MLELTTLYFGSDFLEDHAGQIISSPQVALVEIVANAWDAGAFQVDIRWPEDSVPESFSIQDNGIGMTSDEFEHRWRELNYNRIDAQGPEVIFPREIRNYRRKAYGRNGKGRHSVFCFTGEYTIETWCQGQSNTYTVARSSGRASAPFKITHKETKVREGHGTKISGQLARNYISPAEIRDLIGAKFVADPQFRIVINDEPVEMTDLSHLQDVDEVEVSGWGKIRIRTIDTKHSMRRSFQHGVAWWVNGRLVGEVGWRRLEQNYRYLDARIAAAKRYIFIVEADFLSDDVLPDWSEFRNTPRYRDTFTAFANYLSEKIVDLFRDEHRNKKAAVLRPYRSVLRDLPTDARFHVAQFIDELQSAMPTIAEKDLSVVVQVMLNLEQSRVGTKLLHQIADLQPGDIDVLSDLLDNWTVQEIRTIIGELEWRLSVISSLEKMVHDKSSDELHGIHPLIERGLWMFGPEYEAVSYLSNRTLLTIVQKFLAAELKVPLSTPKQRPDLIVLPDRTVSLHSSDSFDRESHEVDGISSILIIELKRGGFEITRKEKQQAMDYIYEIRKANNVRPTTRITAYVLGASVASDAMNETKEGDTITVTAQPYHTILRRAHARTFYLLDRIRRLRDDVADDPVVTELLSQPTQDRIWR